MKLTIDGRLVAVDGGGDRHMYVFHEYGCWSVLTVTARAALDTGGDDATASVVVEQATSLAEVAVTVDRHGGSGTWRRLLETHDALRTEADCDRRRRRAR